MPVSQNVVDGLSLLKKAADLFAQGSENVDALKRDLTSAFDQVVAAAAGQFAAKADGTPYTDAEIHEARLEADAPLDEILARHGAH